MDSGGLRRAFHGGGDRKRLFSFQREMSSRGALQLAPSKKRRPESLESSSLSFLAGGCGHVHGGERWVAQELWLKMYSKWPDEEESENYDCGGKKEIKLNRFSNYTRNNMKVQYLNPSDEI
jgi:hypothetical protein